MADKNAKSSKRDRQRKSGQNLKYINEKRHDKSHIKRLKEHIQRYGIASDAEATLVRYGTKVGQREVTSIMEFIKQAKAA